METDELNVPPTNAQGISSPDYSTLIRLCEHSHQNKWQTLHIFLVFHTILLVAWVQLLLNRPVSSVVWGRHVLTIVLPGIGILSGMIWSFLGRDCDDASKLFREIVENFEDRFPLEMRTQQRRAKQEKKWWTKLTNTRRIVVLTPLFFVLLDGFLIYVAIRN